MKRLLYKLLFVFTILFSCVSAVSADTCQIKGGYVYYNGVKYSKTCLSAGGSANSGSAQCYMASKQEQAAIDWAKSKYSGNNLQFVLRLLVQANKLGDSSQIGTTGSSVIRFIYNYATIGKLDHYLNSHGWGDYLTTKFGGPYKTIEEAENAYLKNELNYGDPEAWRAYAHDMVTLQNKTPNIADFKKMVYSVVNYTGGTLGTNQKKQSASLGEKYTQDYSIEKFATSYNPIIKLSTGSEESKLEEQDPPKPKKGNKTTPDAPTCNNGGLVKTGSNLTKTGGTVTFAYTGDGQLTGATAECKNCSASAAAAGNTVVVTVTVAASNSSGATTADDDEVCILEAGKKQCQYDVTVKAQVTLTTLPNEDGTTSAVVPEDTSTYDSAPTYLNVVTAGSKNQNFLATKAKNQTPPQSTPGVQTQTCEVAGAASGVFDCGGPTTPIDCEGSMTPSTTNSTGNCCEESQNEIHEDPLNALFCASPKLGAPYYKALTGADYYMDGYAASKLSGVSEYCKVYCTERATVKQPGALTATSGSTFKLNSLTTDNGITTTSAYVKSFKRCREIINYHKWVTDYRQVVARQVENFDDYHFAKTMLAQYDYKFIDEGNVAISASRTCYEWDSTNQKWTATDSREKTEHSPWNYYDFKEKTEPQQKYKVVIINPDLHVHRGPKNYSSIKVELDRKGQYVQESCAERWEPSLASCEISEDRRPSQPGLMLAKHTKQSVVHAVQKAYNDKVDVVNSYVKGLSCSQKKVDSLASKKSLCEVPDSSYIPDRVETLSDMVDSLPGSYDAAANDAKDKEQKLKECHNFFNSTSADDMYKVNTEMNFSYVQTYVNEDMQCITDQQYVQYNPSNGSKNCTISGPNIGADGENGTEDKTYSSEYGGGEESMLDMKAGAINSFTNDEEFKADKMFSIDAVYRADCYKNEGTNTLENEYPSGNVLVADHGSAITQNFNKTIHQQEYYLQVTTMTGVYETYWEIHGLGEGGKFDPYIGQGDTCAGIKAEASTVTSALANGSCGDRYYRSKAHLDDNVYTCKLTVVEELVQTGKCNDTAPYKGCKIDIEGYNYFNFKLVDESNLFPACSLSTNPSDDKLQGCFNGNKYGFNWLADSHGQKALREIQQAGATGATYSPAKLTYSVNLTPESINSIRKYNETVGTYDDFDLTCEGNGTTVGCTLVPGENTCISPTGLTKCKSKFMESFYGSGVLPVTGGKVEKSKGSITTIRNKIWK